MTILRREKKMAEEYENFYNLRELVPTIYGKYIIVKGTHPDCLFANLHGVAEAIVATRHSWPGYNVFVDWSDLTLEPFYNYFNIAISNEFATNYSDMPKTTRNSIAPTPITFDTLFDGPPANAEDYMCVVYKPDCYIPQPREDADNYDDQLRTVLRENLKPLWEYQKIARGRHKDKYNKGKVVIGCDCRYICEDTLGDYCNYIDSLVVKNLKSRVFLTGASSIHYNYMLERYSPRSSSRKSRFKDPLLNELLSVIQLSLCNFIVGTDASPIYSYLSNFIEPDNMYNVPTYV